MSSRISRSGNKSKVIIKIENGQADKGDSVSFGSSSNKNQQRPEPEETATRGKTDGEIVIDGSGTVRVPVPYICTFYNV